MHIRNIQNQDVVSWSIISRYQKLSEKFIAHNSERLDWTKIYEYQELSKEFFFANIAIK